jgi:hypothetical protein
VAGSFEFFENYVQDIPAVRIMLSMGMIMHSTINAAIMETNILRLSFFFWDDFFCCFNGFSFLRPHAYTFRNLRMVPELPPTPMMRPAARNTTST